MYDDYDDQEEFDFEEPDDDGGKRRRSIQEAYEEFNKAHPEVMTYLVALAFELYRKGWVHYGIGALWERMRWHFWVEKELGEDFKLNNNFRSRYARRIMADHPELVDFFELRALTAE